MDQGGRLLAATVSAAPVPPPAALDGEGTPRQDRLPPILQQMQLPNSQAGQFSHRSRLSVILKGVLTIGWLRNTLVLPQWTSALCLSWSRPINRSLCVCWKTTRSSFFTSWHASFTPVSPLNEAHQIELQNKSRDSVLYRQRLDERKKKKMRAFACADHR